MPTPQFQQSLQQAMQHHRAGQLDSAEAICNQILANNPNQPDSLNLLGLIAQQRGQKDLAINLAQQVVALLPAAAAYTNLGNALRDNDQFDDAVKAYHKAISLKPDFAEAHNNLGSAFLRAGKLEQAADAYRSAVKFKPDFAKAHNNLAIVLQKQGKLQEAVTEYRIATQFQPQYAIAFFNLGNALQELGDQELAIQNWRQAANLSPQMVDAHSSLGLALVRQKRFAEAAESFAALVKLLPNNPDAHFNLSNTLREQNKLDQARDELIATLKLNPQHFQAHVNLGVVLNTQVQYEQAEAALKTALSLQPDDPIALMNMGNTLLALGRVPEAYDILEKSVRLKPDFADAHNNLGTALNGLGRRDEALAAYQRSLQLNPDLASAHGNLGNFYVQEGRVDVGLPELKRAVELQPENGVARWNWALAMLLKGDLANGWVEYECRMSVPEFKLPPHSFPRPRWDGSDLTGKRLLVHAEQGFGDAIQFVRDIPLLAQRGAQVILRCQPNLINLFQTLPGIHRIIPEGQTLPADQFDLHYPLLSLPLIFKTTFDTIPADVPYLHADESAIEKWKQCLPKTHDLKIGLAWSGNVDRTINPRRSVSLDTLEPLLKIPGTWFCSLQKGPAAAQAQAFGLTDWTHELKDFADTAALISSLDLVISIDTAVAHLAGALAKPTWTLLLLDPDWRWFMDRSDSPWYPTMRLFRQTQMADWTAPVNKIANQLQLQTSR